MIYAYSLHHRAKMRGRWNNCELVFDAYAFAQVFVCLFFVLFVCLFEMMAQNFTPMNQDATRIKLIHLL